jgi:hypothetical protein
MEKESTLEHLRNAKKAHIRWVQRAKALVEGLPVEKEQIPLNSTECAFGEWYYGEGQSIGLMPGMDSFKEIEQGHFELHDVYMKIFKIYYSDANLSFFAKLLGKKKKVSHDDQQIAQDYYEQLKTVSEKLLTTIERVERRLSALPQTAFNG